MQLPSIKVCGKGQVHWNPTSLAITVQLCPGRQASSVQRLASICTTKKQRIKIQSNEHLLQVELCWLLYYGLNKQEMCYNIFIDLLHFDIKDLHHMQ